tara:strand:+ start:540 stop:803 length:264 start_codon:yes stop_codon:yes gene_type:complete
MYNKQNKVQKSKNGVKKSNMDKWKYSLMSAIVFLVVVNPETYKLVESLLGGVVGKVADVKTGCPTELGIFVHAVVFTLVIRGLMELK